MKMPDVSSYGQYSSNNYGLNALKISLETITLYYSYCTIVAFYTYEDGLVVSKNIWSTTTGKHLNWIDGGHKSARVDNVQFEILLEKALNRHIQ